MSVNFVEFKISIKLRTSSIIFLSKPSIRFGIYVYVGHLLRTQTKKNFLFIIFISSQFFFSLLYRPIHHPSIDENSLNKNIWEHKFNGATPVFEKESANINKQMWLETKQQIESNLLQKISWRMIWHVWINHASSSFSFPLSWPRSRIALKSRSLVASGFLFGNLVRSCIGCLWNTSPCL